jgi:hypothetical protein
MAVSLRKAAKSTWNKICSELLMQYLLPLKLMHSEQGMAGCSRSPASNRQSSR